jgi:uncharacterized membrane protein SpoIIM required for sporulation
MREALFIKRNRDKWIKYQRDLNKDPDVQAERFITLLDDLSYSRTFYPRSAVTRWINGIVARIYQSIYQNKKEQRNRFAQFWIKELPLVVYEHRRVFAFTLLFFIGSAALGILSAATDEYFIKAILGESYVAMTEENIAKGDPFGVYRDADQFTMFVRIAANNIRISFLAFVAGISFGIGTLFILFQNGVMVGCFEYLFFAKGLGWQSVLVIWIHGTIEISSVIIAGTAGLILGMGILFPETYSRIESFKRAVKNALKLALALVPFFLAAALLETYVTFRMSDTFSNKGAAGLPVWAGLIILAASLWFMVWYFYWYPRQVARKENQKAVEAAAKKHQVIQWQV